MVRILFFGDIVGRPGRKAVAIRLPELKEQLHPDLIIANGENAAGGFGIQPDTAQEIFRSGVELITTGNHIWSKREIHPYLDAHPDRILRPINFSAGAPGAGLLYHRLSSGVTVALVNVIGRVFMPDLVDCPFQAMDAVLQRIRTEHPDALVFCDFHAEATSEKVAMGHFLDGKASVVVGTHTHVQTADAMILPGGTAYITDVGMCGPEDGVIGCEKQPIIDKFVTGRPHKFDVAKGPAIVNAISVDIDPETRKAQKIERIYWRERDGSSAA